MLGLKGKNRTLMIIFDFHVKINLTGEPLSHRPTKRLSTGCERSEL